METSSVLLVCILVTCSVWTVHGGSFEVSIDDQEQVDVDISVKASKLPGVCWACNWALKKVKKQVGRNGTVEKLTSMLNSICDQIGLLKSLCRKFVKTHLPELVEELTTTDDVRTICVNAGACKPKELLDLHLYQMDEESSIEMNEYP
ncbi:antimicrobial peptide NK-lysin-like [Perca fluviatilis]|uniref:antimicrobial peptide NK-lysin-like n=1 Tax=Perca fluviatilis TaxID=8168 RepID=UPI0019622CF3|nr:antimicrobial peptide NK-lysin-like [Perca fluviatilis]